MSWKSVDSVSFVFPAYNDEGTIKHVIEKAVKVSQQMQLKYEVIVVNDCSPDRSGAFADEMARANSNIKVVHHSKNMGYGAALKSGIAAATMDWIVLTDGDDQYDLLDTPKLMNVAHRYDLIITFRYKKIYSAWRIFLSWAYNFALRALFKTSFRDISTGLRMMRREVLNEIELKSDGNILGAELAIKTMLKGYAVGEVGIQTFPRTFGSSSSMKLKNITYALVEIRRLYKELFS